MTPKKSDHIAGFLDLEYPPKGFEYVGNWGPGGHIFLKSGLCVIIDCSKKSDGKQWCHVSYSRKLRVPDHKDTILVKKSFIGPSRYAYAVYPPFDKYVNIHPFCLHLWSLCEGNGRVLPEFSEQLSI
jgi:hypothetical protein